MREIFIDGLYKVSVSQARMQMVVDGLDPVSTLLNIYGAILVPDLCIMILCVLSIIKCCTRCTSFILLAWHMVCEQVLGELCEVIVEPLRDRVVLGLLQAALVRYFHYVALS